MIKLQHNGITRNHVTGKRAVSQIIKLIVFDIRDRSGTHAQLISYLI